MLQEFLHEFMNHERQYPEFDIDTLVRENYILKPGLYIRIHENNSMDEIYIAKKTEPLTNDPLTEWFKQADFASSLVEMNKPVDPKKKIHSNNMFTLFCKREVFYEKGAVQPQLAEHIDRYYKALLSPKDKESEQILENAGYKPLGEDELKTCKERFLAALDQVAELIKQMNIKDNGYIKLFLARELKEYIYEGERYLLPKVFNSHAFNIEVEGQVLGLSNTDMGMNAKKPYLEHKTTPFRVPYRVTSQQALWLRKLYLWLNGQKRDGKALYEGYIPAWNHAPQLLLQVAEVDERSPVLYAHFARGIDISIDDSDFLPSFSDRMRRPIHFADYLKVAGYQGGQRSKLSEVETHINEHLYAFQLVRNYYEERVKASEKVSQALADQVMASREAWRAWLRKGDSLLLQSKLEPITQGAILVRLPGLEYIPALAYALNVRFSLLKYFSEEGSDVGNVMEITYEDLKNKVLSPPEAIITCANDAEFYMTAGQLLRYLFSLSEAQTMKYDVFWREIRNARDADGIKKVCYRNHEHYAYRIGEDKEVRVNAMLSIVSSYTAEKEGLNMDALLFGFASPNIIYYQDPNKAKGDIN